MLLLVTIVLVVIAALTLVIGIVQDSLEFIFVSIGASALAAGVLAALSQMNKRKAREGVAAAGTSAFETPVTASAGSRVEEPVAAASDATAAGGPPIPNYDTLRVNEILPALEALGLDQLEEVAQLEESNKNRTTVLNRIEQLMDELEAGEGAAAPVAEPTIATAAGSDDGFPIPDYDSLSEDEVIGLLDDLDADELETVADREEAGPNRDAVLDAIDDRLDILEGIVAAPAKKVPGKKAPAAKASAKKAPAKKAPAKKSPVRKTASRAPAKTSPPLSRTASRAPAKKAPAKKAAPSRSTSAKKAVKKTGASAKKAAPVKKATTAKKASRR